ncbi:MAG TPA: polynucleotide adenylyltransferase PcnB [Candidatus Macondimonas sp.]|nr:polynucleotide adenylyltransferase PcnB [Candidatus Macondimonas sp.]
MQNTARVHDIPSLSNPSPASAQAPGLVIVPRAEHALSRSQIAAPALKVLYRLKAANYQAFLVGGGVRDVLLGLQPKDFDIATNALPEEVRATFSNCRLIGRRFRLAHVHFGGHVVEVATFRGAGAEGDEAVVVDERGRVLRDNVYGSLEEDAWRRDFTVNALYYSIEDFSIHDYVGGMADLQNRVLRLIGDPWTRYREDPVRMLRAVRFAAKLGFSLEARTAQALAELSALLADISPARLYDESLKLFLGGHAAQTFTLLREHGLFGYLFPATEAVMRREGEQGPTVRLLYQAMVNTDQRIAEGKPVTPAFLFAALGWGPVREAVAARIGAGMPPPQAMLEASEFIDTAMPVLPPRRFRAPMQEIWRLQHRFESTTPKRARVLLSHPRFRAAYDFLLLRGHAGEVPEALHNWWTMLQLASSEEQDALLQQPPQLLTADAAPARRRRRRRAPRRRPEGAATP